MILPFPDSDKRSSEDMVGIFVTDVPSSSKICKKFMFSISSGRILRIEQPEHTSSCRSLSLSNPWGSFSSILQSFTLNMTSLTMVVGSSVIAVPSKYRASSVSETTRKFLSFEQLLRMSVFSGTHLVSRKDSRAVQPFRFRRTRLFMLCNSGSTVSSAVQPSRFSLCSF